MRHVFTILLLLSSLFASAQSGTVSGKLTDSVGKRNLALATVTIFRAKDTSIITYRLSTENGEFRVPGLPLNLPLRLMATFSGFEAFRKDFTLTEKDPTLNIGAIALTGTSKQLDEVIVVSERPPVVIKQDTIEFNASAFKTLPSALLEDLLKKLPGVIVNENGDITVNGQKVNRLLVDGKKFFGDNPQMATRNLPSNMIDKVQVMDDKEQIDLNNDGDMSKIGKVLNITLKKAIKKAVFGRVFAGGGTDERYESGAIINSFRDTLQMSLIGFANNINRSSFTTGDITQLGGFSRSGWGNINGNGSPVGGQSGFTVDGFSLGGTGGGIATANGIGFNLNHSPSTRVNFSFQYMYGNTHNDLAQIQNIQRFYGDTIVNARTVTNSVANGWTHNLSTSGAWKPDTLTTMNIRLAYANANNGIDAPSYLVTENNKIGQLNTANGVLVTHNNSDFLNEVFTFSRRSRKVKGRLLSITQVFNTTWNPYSAQTENVNTYQYPVFSNVLFQQLRATNQPARNVYLFVNYSTPLSAKLTLRLNPSYSYQKNTQDISTFRKHFGNSEYDSLVTALSSNLVREMTRWSNGGTLSYKINNVNLNLGGQWLQQWINNSFTQSSFNSKQYYSDLLLNMSVNWKRFSFGFSQDVYAQGIYSQIPVPDNSNPFNVYYGNPNLRPGRRNNFNFNGSVFNAKTNTNFYFSGSTSITDDGLINANTLSGDGVQTYRPINVNGIWSNYLDLDFSRQFKNKQSLNITARIQANASVNRTPINFNNESSRLTTLGLAGGASVALNWQDKIEFTPKYNISSNQSYYTSQSFVAKNITQKILQGEFIVRMPRKIVWETNIYYRHLNEVAPGLPNSSIYWNAAVTLLMFKQDKGQLRLAVYDILNSNRSVNRYYSSNAIIDNNVNVLQRYFMLTYTYNIRSFGNQSTKVGGTKSLWNF